MTEELRPSAGSVNPAELPATLLTTSKPYLRVLHVNDSTDDQVMFQAACRRGNVPFNWHVAESAERGISYLRTLIEQSKSIDVCWPDLIVLDIVMPMTTGFEVLKYVRATPELKDLPVIIFTGDISPRNEEESAKLGANLYLSKPSDFLQIVELAQKLYGLIRQLGPGKLLPRMRGQ